MIPSEPQIESIIYKPIGVIHSPFTNLAHMPIQPSSRASATGSALILPAYQAGLKDLEGFSHVILIYHLHRVTRCDLTVTPFLDREPRGVFATRAPTRPNPIGLSVVRLLAVKAGELSLGNLDILDGAPLLDVKPYVPEFDQPEGSIRAGWLEAAQARARTTRSDERFR